MFVKFKEYVSNNNNKNKNKIKSVSLLQMNERKKDAYKYEPWEEEPWFGGV